MTQPAKRRTKRKTNAAVPGPQTPEIGRFRAQHLSLAQHEFADGAQQRHVATVNEAESPLAWLARRKGRDGRPLIEPEQLQAGERLRADFTRAQAMPRLGADWSSPIGGGGRSGMPTGSFTDTMIAARQRVRQALTTAGPEFAGLLIDVCCFLKGLEEVERERRWPARSGKIVLQLGLDRLARHYGLRSQARGTAHAAVWFADDDAAQNG